MEFQRPIDYKVPIRVGFSAEANSAIQDAASQVHTDPGFNEDPGSAVAGYVAQHFGTLSEPQQTVVQHAILSDLAGMDDIDELQAEQLQMAMDRTSKMMESLSNLDKLISDTSDSIIQNLK